jgi:sugar phosphate isomerase/epimerase
MALLRACQTRTWGPRQSRRLDAILRVSAEAGFEGIEIDLAQLAGIGLRRVHDRVRAHGLRVAALNLGDFLGLRAADRARQLAEALATLSALDAPLLICSGPEAWATHGLAAGVGALNRAAVACAELGRQLLYHHRAYEFAPGARVLSALAQDTFPDIGFCLDVGWLSKAKVPLVATLVQFRSRLGAVHLTDFASTDPALDDRVEPGAGVVPLARAAAWLRRSRLDGLWVVADPPAASGFPAQRVRRSGAFLIQELGQRGRPAEV